MAVRMVALLRGINVGRNKQIAMADLRAVLTALGYADVETHLRSGNAAFTADPGAARTAAADIERAVAGKLGMRSSVIVRTGTELDAVLTNAPMLDLMTDPARYLVGFLADDPAPDAADAIAAIDVDPDRIRLVRSEVYLWCPAGIAASPLNKTGWERALGVDVTTRNWRTVEKLTAMARR
ncbi:MAG: DUF1697 domain-containing protein [Streptosporangiales bacterium]